MRLVITTGIFPPDIGGPATHSLHLSAELRARGHEVTILSLTDLPHTVFEPGVVRHPRAWPWPLRTAVGAWWLVRNRRRYDAVYATGLDLTAVIGGRLAGRPVVLKVVGDPAWERASRRGLTRSAFSAFQAEGGGPVGVRGMRAMRSWTARHASAVVTPSEHLRQAIDVWVHGRRDVVVVPNGARANPFARDAVRDPSSLRLLFVGRLVGLKRVGLLIDAVAVSDGVTLDIVGDGPERSSLEARARRLRLESRVNFAGPVSPDEVLKRLSDADVLVNASTHEGLPHVAVEALVSGVPIVCSRAGGMVEIVHHEHNGLLVDDAAAATFASAFARIRDDPGLLERLAAGARETSEGWRFERTADRIEEVLHGVVDGLPAPDGDDRPAAVFVGRAIPLPPSAELRRKFALHSRLLRQLSVTTGKRGMWRVSGVTVLALPQVRPPLLGGVLFYSCAPFLALPAAMARRGAIVCQSPYEALGIIAVSRLVPRRMRPRIQVELHGDWRTAPRLYGSRARSLLGPLCDRGCEWALRRADRVRVVSGRLADQARQAGYSGLIDRHFTFSDFSAFLERSPLPLPPAPRAVFIGVLERYKAIDQLVDVWPEVVGRVPGAELVVVGEGTLGPELKRRAQRRRIGGLQFRRPMTPHELASLLDSATCLVLPSRSEGLPRVVMEAMARGRAVVASDVGGMRELVDDGVSGYLVPPEDVLALAEALVNVLSRRDVAEGMGREARQRAEARDPAGEYEAGIARLAGWIAER